jgi:hypothetical protein
MMLGLAQASPAELVLQQESLTPEQMVKMKSESLAAEEDRRNKLCGWWQEYDMPYYGAQQKSSSGISDEAQIACHTKTGVKVALVAAALATGWLLIGGGK